METNINKILNAIHGEIRDYYCKITSYIFLSHIWRFISSFKWCWQQPQQIVNFILKIKICKYSEQLLCNFVLQFVLKHMFSFLSYSWFKSTNNNIKRNESGPNMLFYI